MLNVNLISLGCTKNLVDSEVMLGLVKESGYHITADPSDADIVIVNTCGFIESARQESVETIRSVKKLRKSGKLRALIVAGCLPKKERDALHGGRLADFAVDVDAFVGPGDFSRISEVIGSVITDNKNQSAGVFVESNPTFIYDSDSPRLISTPSHSVYVKIAEGCSNKCSYCSIPAIRGEFRSRKIESIVAESERLCEGGAVELNLIAQDTTNYGIDIYGKRSINNLLERLAGIGRVRWIRLMYTHPAHFEGSLVSVIKNNPKICRYIDLPIQHIDDEILRSMGRRSDSARITSLIKELRREIPGVVIRTSVIVGYPGETDEKFSRLVSFLRETKFERLGAFKYSREPGTPAYSMDGMVSQEVIDIRFDQVMRLQQEISLRNNRKFIGRTIYVLVDRKLDGEVWTGRTQGDAPDVDGTVVIKKPRKELCLTNPEILPGKIIKVRIEKTYEYDLEGIAV